MTFELSREIVFATTPPHPASKALAITRPFVPGGPEPMTKGLMNFIPFTSTASVPLAMCVPPNRSPSSEAPMTRPQSSGVHGREAVLEYLQRFLDLALSHDEGRRDAHDVAVEPSSTDEEAPLLGLLEEGQHRSHIRRAIALLLVLAELAGLPEPPA